MVKYVVDDYRDFEIKAKAPPPTKMTPIAKIVDVGYPSEAEPGEEVVVEATVTNTGYSGTIFARLKDKETGEELGFADEDVAGGESVKFKFTLKMPNKPLNLRLEAGHYE